MAGRVITIAQCKGGAGKTTLAAQLAVAWARQGAKLALLDIDPQASLSAWIGLRRSRLGDAAIGFEFAALPGWRAEQWIADHARAVDLVIVDGPAHIETEARIAVRAAGLVLIPVQPSPLDLWATAATIAIARDERRQVLAVLNRVAPRSTVTERIAGELSQAGAPIAASRIGNRIALVHAMAQGFGVLETAAASPAAAEVTALADEICGIS
jgi:chromosome partitioning protein